MPGLGKLTQFDLRLQLINKLSSVLNREVDVVDLSSAPLALQHQVLLTGELILEKDYQQRIQFEVASRREYFDIKRHLDRRAEAFLGSL